MCWGVAALEPIDEVEKIVGELRGLDIGAFFEDAELRRACTDTLKGWGCPNIIAPLMVQAAAGLVGFCEEGAAANIRRRLLRIAAATPGVQAT